MRVCHVLNEISFSGAEIMLIDASSQFEQNGLELYALSTGDEVGDYAKVFKEHNFNVNHLPFSKTLKFSKSYYKLLKENEIDVLHIHTERAFFLYALIAKLAGISNIVRTVHNVFPFKGFTWFTRYTLRMFSRKLLGMKFLTISESVYQVEKIVYHNPTRLIRNWIDREKFVPVENNKEKQELRRKFNISEKAIVVISVGRCTNVKNHKAILDTIHLLDGDDVKDLVYLHLGNGSLTQEEKEYTKQLKIEKRVRFIGETNDVRSYLVISDIFLMPSLYEGLGNSLLEAMSCGLPSIVYDVYGLKDLIDNGINGFKVECTSEAMAKSLLTLVSDAALRKKMGTMAIQKIEKNYNKKRSIQQLMDAYSC